MSECADGFVKHNAAMVEDFLKLSCSFAAPAQQKVRLSTDIDRIQTYKRPSQVVGSYRLQQINGFCRMAEMDFNGGSDRGDSVAIDHGVQGKAFGQFTSQPLGAGDIAGVCQRDSRQSLNLLVCGEGQG